MNVLPLAIESMVAGLLLLTILYCIRLSAQLKRLKADESAMKATIAELLAASGTAERAIGALKDVVREADQKLGERLRAAEQFSTDMQRSMDAGSDILNRLMQIAGAKPWLLGDEPEEEKPRPVVPDARAIAAAANAIAERARARVRAIAA
ncbi:MAG: chemotaxis protein [Rhizobiales bacterium]|jgi:hypothetical protein|nr:chemotaxis protein [Hyphomicrobiales bacterium]